jgi:hypothetical protein
MCEKPLEDALFECYYLACEKKVRLETVELIISNRCFLAQNSMHVYNNTHTLS